MLTEDYTVPADLRTMLATIRRGSRCVHCGMPLFSRDGPKGLPPDLELDKNALGELIALCECRSCGKPSPLAFRK